MQCYGVLFCGEKWCVVTMLSMFHVCLSKIKKTFVYTWCYVKNLTILYGVMWF